MRGILSVGAYVPRGRLDRTTIAAVAGQGGGTGTRSVASYDEDTTTMAVAAGAAAGGTPAALWFATTAPAYLDKANASAVHAALRLDRSAPAYDAVGSVRSTMGALRAALDFAGGPALAVAADVRGGLPGSAEESSGGDGAAAVLAGDGDVVAEVLAWGAATEDVLDRWRSPGDVRSKLWEERFGETRYGPLADEALAATGIDLATIDVLLVAGPHDRAVAQARTRLGNGVDPPPVGNTGAAQPLLLLAGALESAEPGTTILLLTLADGADAVVLRTTPAIADHRPVAPLAEQLRHTRSVPYGRYLAWRGHLPVEPPRRPEPARPSAAAAARNADWKFGLEGFAGRQGTVVTFTVDRLAYSPSPPVVFAVVDFDGGGRLPVELTDVDPADVSVGSRVEPTFRRLFTADGIHNYFWKARLVRP